MLADRGTMRRIMLCQHFTYRIRASKGTALTVLIQAKVVLVIKMVLLYIFFQT